MDIPTQCPVCGAYSISHDTHAAALLAVCDVLVVKTLETIGKRIVRAERSRYRVLGGRPWHLAHTLSDGEGRPWRMSDHEVGKSLAGAWDVVPALLETHAQGCCEVTARQVQAMLDQYVRDLVVTGTGHNLDDLCYRFVRDLGLPVWLRDDEREATLA